MAARRMSDQRGGAKFFGNGSNNLSEKTKMANYILKQKNKSPKQKNKHVFVCCSESGNPSLMLENEALALKKTYPNIKILPN